MRFILKTLIKIIIFFIVIIIPIGFFITFFVLNQRDIPVWNIGIRNILITTKDFALPTIIISFLFATLLTISLVDKMKVRSIFVLHIPAVLIGIALIIAFYGIQKNEQPLAIMAKDVRLGYLSFFRDNVFNQINNHSIMVKKPKRNIYTVYIYDKSNNKLTILNNVSYGKKGKNYMYINKDRKQIEFFYTQRGKSMVISVPFSDFRVKNSSINNRFIIFYVNQLRKTLTSIRGLYAKLTKIDVYILLGALFLSILMISIPLSYALNDGGWGFSGIIGVIFIFLVLPFLYGGVLRFLLNARINAAFLGRFSYLFPSIIFCGIGILFDILIKVRGMKKGI
jgi:hypothetical protein